jgi:hypothetical protein
VYPVLRDTRSAALAFVVVASYRLICCSVNRLFLIVREQRQVSSRSPLNQDVQLGCKLSSI